MLKMLGKQGQQIRTVTIQNDCKLDCKKPKLSNQKIGTGIKRFLERRK